MKRPKRLVAKLDGVVEVQTLVLYVKPGNSELQKICIKMLKKVHVIIKNIY